MPANTSAISARQPDEVDLDAIDRVLISALQEDGRLSYADLAKLVALTPGGVRKRVMRLEEQDVVQVVGVTDPLRMGYRSMAMLGVSVRGDAEVVADALSALDCVIYVVFTAGQFNLMVEVIAEDQDDLFAVINRDVSGISGVIRVESFPYFSIHTHRFGWGTR
ncbi:Lrp/AsnC family transcriptional regulator for asnA, asnC and gidA [Leucobacter exalbidus]|uniref:Lrp/AsnC family transcriptional regulator for asnA, asnC and gidA n=1 Tax=Leucobacter exalbidus TaxID=662960 RepID=A0A940PWA2_9MICO|nr:AsnC family transcriptional regulator [Leucobacter exalbidus]MBP1326316.1 Lrp/AsnC family transcriptional regulator for asnA, asnC and gidA [Leucobacter exalbidus]